MIKTTSTLLLLVALAGSLTAQTTTLAANPGQRIQVHYQTQAVPRNAPEDTVGAWERLSVAGSEFEDDPSSTPLVRVKLPW